MEILLVEDNLLQARLTTEAIKQGNFRHRTTLVRDGQEALDFLGQRGRFARAPHPDLILLDLRLPKIDGLDVLNQIKSDELLRGAPVVVLTSSDCPEDRSTCEGHDVAAYLSKPVQLKEFLTLLRELKQYWHEDMVLPRSALL